jgi:hypothetical protein
MTSEKKAVRFDRKTKEFVGLTDAVKEELRTTYYHTDVEKELTRMKAWLLGPKGKRHVGTMGFILNWLNNSSPTPMRTAQFFDIVQSDSPLSVVLNEYLQDLWKNREHLYLFNTIKR